MPDPRDQTVCNLLYLIVCALVDHPEAVRIEAWTHLGAITITAYVSPADIGRVVGKQGQTVKSIRTVILGIATKLERKYKFVIAGGA